MSAALLESLERMLEAVESALERARRVSQLYENALRALQPPPREASTSQTPPREPTAARGAAAAAATDDRTTAQMISAMLAPLDSIIEAARRAREEELALVSGVAPPPQAERPAASATKRARGPKKPAKPPPKRASAPAPAPAPAPAAAEAQAWAGPERLHLPPPFLQLCREVVRARQVLLGRERRRGARSEAVAAARAQFLAACEGVPGAPAPASASAEDAAYLARAVAALDAESRPVLVATCVHSGAAASQAEPLVSQQRAEAARACAAARQRGAWLLARGELLLHRAVRQGAREWMREAAAAPSDRQALRVYQALRAALCSRWRAPPPAVLLAEAEAAQFD